jgi:hypothetical protein
LFLFHQMFYHMCLTHLSLKPFFFPQTYYTQLSKAWHDCFIPVGFCSLRQNNEKHALNQRSIQKHLQVRAAQLFVSPTQFLNLSWTHQTRLSSQISCIFLWSIDRTSYHKWFTNKFFFIDWTNSKQER